MARSKTPKVVYPPAPLPLAIRPGESASPPPPATGPRKKARSALSKVKGTKGKLAAMTSLPIDLIYDICSNLGPADLYALSNTSKVWRSVVVGPSSSKLWREARERVGLPELDLANMTDLQYAALMHGKGCNFCGKMNAGKPDPYFRARICGACLKKDVAGSITSAGVNALARAADNNLHPMTTFCCTPTISGRNGPSFYLPQVKRVSAELHASGYSTTEYRDRVFVTTLRYSPSDSPAPETTSDFQKWYLETDEPRKQRQADGDRLGRWLKTQDEAKADDKNDIRKTRLEELKKRFKAQGFQDVELNSHEFLYDSNTRKPNPVNDRSWPTAERQLKPVLVAVRRKLRRHGVGDALFQLRNGHPASASFPPEDVFFQLPPVKAVVEDLSAYQKPSELFNDHRDEFVTALEGLIRSRREALLRTLAKAYIALRTAQEQEAANGQTAPPCAVKGLTWAAVDLPRLPPWIPRTDDQPFTATDEQIQTFFDSSPMAWFSCEKCGVLQKGAAIFSHVGQRWGCYSATMDAITSTDPWCRMDDTLKSMVTTRDQLFAVLYLGQLFALSPDDADEAVDRPAREVGIKMKPEEKLTVSVSCGCNSGNLMFSQSLFNSLSNAYRHLKVHHGSAAPTAVKLTRRADLTPRFRQALRTNGIAHVIGEDDYYGDSVGDIDMFDAFGFGPGLGGGGYGGGLYGDGYSDGLSDDSMDAREDCVIM
ncbi:hypothetical protein JCM10207_007626 [Rhodosporidiobolus poonsookiae]